MINVGHYMSPIGSITIASKDGNLIGLWIENQENFLSSIKEEIIENNEDSTIIKTKLWLDKYFNNEHPNINELSLSPSGTEFQLRVWNILKEIPYGKTITYKDIADKIATEKNIKKMSSQAVGQAVGHNPISIIIPCHRVVGRNGNLTGYAGGLEIKVKLLKHEGIDMNNFYLPK